MTKLWCIAIAIGGPEDGMVVVSMQMSGLQEMAVAQAVSDMYRQTGTKLPMMGVNARELRREYLVEALRLIDEHEQDVKPPEVVRLVQTPDVKCPSCGTTENYPGMCPVCGPRPGYIPIEDEPA